jgi:excisionase family DNA binding protein
MHFPPNDHRRDTSVQARLVSVREAARLLGIGLTKTYELISDGLLETVTIGSRRLVTLRSIDALIDSAANGQAA